MLRLDPGESPGENQREIHERMSPPESATISRSHASIERDFGETS
jgi:hypothetical protein